MTMRRPEDWPQELKRLQLDNKRERFAKLDERKAPSWRSKRPGMSSQHLINVRKLPCLLCGRRDGVEAHHLKAGPAARERGVFMKATDRWAVPLCREHHNEIERKGSRREREEFGRWGHDPQAAAQGLWNKRGDPIAMDFVVRAHQQQAIRTLSSKRDLVVDLKSGEWRRV
jgi:hypothetical protein